MAPFSTDRFMPRFAFSEDDLVIIDDRPLRLVHRNSEGCSFQPEPGGLSEHFTHPELADLQRHNRISVERRHFLDKSARHSLDRSDLLHTFLDGPIEERVRFRESLVLGFKEVQRQQADSGEKPSLNRTDRSIEAHADRISAASRAFFAKIQSSSKVQNAPSKFTARSLRRWLAQYEAMGRAGLADAHGKSGNRAQRFPREVSAILAEEVRGYLSANKPTKKKIFENVQIAVSDLNDDREARGLPLFDCPSRNAVSAAIGKLDPFTVAVAREGREAAMRRLRQTGQGIGQGLSRPMQRVEMDETKIDLFTLLNESGMIDLFSEAEREVLGLVPKRGRWWITVAICATTRVILGMRLMRNPNTLSALECLQMCLNDKGGYADAAGALSPWSMHGLMELLVTDAGSAFKAADFRTACADLGIRQEIATAGVPQLRARIERVFRTLNLSLLPRLSGRTFESAVARGDHDPLRDTALNVDDLTRALVRWVVDVYHNTPHEGLGGMTPLDAWEQAMLDWGVAPAPGPEVQAQIFSRPMERKLEGDGITVFGVRYHSRELAEWGLHHRGGVVNVRWSPQDLGAIWVKTGKWLKVSAVFEGFSGVRADEWIASARRLRVSLRAGQAVSRRILRRAITEIETINAQARVREGLVTENWEPEVIDRVEKAVFMGFTIADAEEVPDTTPSGDGIGRSVTPLGRPEAPLEEDIPEFRMRRQFDDDWDVQD
ncbi:Mu transposase C-terminal domain-containing protein [Paracoccus hibiscisoli]|uniref:Mu transposase C-terminal domain-containing protein n=1 Tax=Paracoccus hibiscisoli TaxID=2023261 RepID=UPI0023F1EC01|nr:Mu transposase C-terminal domain-containing protein [Paracoccus hibiscisoli]